MDFCESAFVRGAELPASAVALNLLYQPCAGAGPSVNGCCALSDGVV